MTSSSLHQGCPASHICTFGLHFPNCLMSLQSHQGSRRTASGFCCTCLVDGVQTQLLPLSRVLPLALEPLPQVLCLLQWGDQPLRQWDVCKASQHPLCGTGA